jgi:hypothetical protein
MRIRQNSGVHRKQQLMGGGVEALKRRSVKTVEGGFHFGHRKKSFRKLNKVKFQGFWRFWLLHKSGPADKGKVWGHLAPDAAMRIKLLKQLMFDCGANPPAEAGC